MQGSAVPPGAREEVAVLRALPGLGDLLCTLPALRALRAARPLSRIVLIGLPQARFLLERFPHYVDELVEFPGWPGLVEQEAPLRELPAFFTAMQRRRFDLLLQMHGSGIVTNPLAMLFGAARTAGFYLPGQYCPDPSCFLPYPAHLPEVRRHLQLLEFLGMPPRDEALEFPLQEADHAALGQVDECGDLEPGSYVCVHPGASIDRRRWAPERFAAVADGLAERGLRIVLTGSRAEQELTRAVADAMHHQAIDAAGRTSLGALAALLSRARLLLCNDTGVSHLAAALRVPSVVIFIATGPGRWAPLDRRRHRVVGEAHPREELLTACASRCLREGCPVSDDLVLSGLREATVEDALAEAEELLREEQLHAAC